MTSYTKRCFQFSDGRSNKFWTIEVAGLAVFVTYGRIGSVGAAQVKQFPNDVQRDAFVSKMVKEKRNKGYEEVPSALHPGAPYQQIQAARGVSSETAPPVASPPTASGGTTEGQRFLDL